MYFYSVATPIKTKSTFLSVQYQSFQDSTPVFRSCHPTTGARTNGKEMVRYNSQKGWMREGFQDKLRVRCSLELGLGLGYGLRLL